MEANIISEGFSVYVQNSTMDCLKKYATKTLGALRQIQEQWKSYSSDQSELFWSTTILQGVRSLFISYELIILEFNQYCEALQISELGKCMLKIFVQVLQIVKKILSSFLKEVNSSKLKTKAEDFCEACSKRPSLLKLTEGQKQFYSQMEKNKYQAQSIDHGLDIVEKQYIGKDSRQQAARLRKAFEKVVSIESSSAENLIHEAIIEISGKGESLKTFIRSRDTSIKTQTIFQVSKITQILKEELDYEKMKKTGIAIERISEAVQTFLNKRQQARAAKLKCQAVQTESIPFSPEQKQLYERRQSKNMKELATLKNETELEKSRCKNLSLLLTKKTEAFEESLLHQKKLLLQKQKEIAVLEERIENIQKENLKKRDSQVQKNQNIKSEEIYKNKENGLPTEIQVKEKNLVNEGLQNFSNGWPSSHSRRQKRRPNVWKYRHQINNKIQNDLEYLFHLKEKQQQQINFNDGISVKANKNTLSCAFSDIIQFSRFKELQIVSCVLQLNNRTNNIEENFLNESRPSKTLTLSRQKQYRTLSVDHKNLGVQNAPQSGSEKFHRQIKQNYQHPKQLKPNQIRKKQKKVIWNKFQKTLLNNVVAVQKEFRFQSTQQNLYPKMSKARLEIKSSKHENQSDEELIDLSKLKTSVKIRIPKLENLQFTQNDTEDLFLFKQCAIDFQNLNFNLTPYRRQAESFECKDIFFINYFQCFSVV